MTEDNQGKAMAIVLDGVALSAPNIESRIYGAGVISGGGMDDKEVGSLIIVLKSGALPAKPRLESKNFIGPSLVRDAINRGFEFVRLFVEPDETTALLSKTRR